MCGRDPAYIASNQMSIADMFDRQIRALKDESDATDKRIAATIARVQEIIDDYETIDRLFPAD